MYENNLHTIGDLKTPVTARIRAITIEECVRVIGNSTRRLQVCLQRPGGHLEHILHKNLHILERPLDLQTGNFVE